jgi:hypothetical protein
MDSLNSNEDRQLIKIVLPNRMYMFETAKEAIGKLHPSVSNALAFGQVYWPVVAAAAQTQDSVEKMIQAMSMVCNRLEAMEWSASLQLSPCLRPPRSDIICHNCLEPGHFSDQCSLERVSVEQLQVNRETIRRM